MLGDTAHADASPLARRIHLGDVRSEHDRHALPGALRDVSLEVAWIPREILFGAELRRVDENRHRRGSRTKPRLAHERTMAFVQSPHRRDETQRTSVSAQSVRGDAE